jgi:hypothetical protein
MLNPMELSTGPDYALFIGDLGADVTEDMLMQLFTSYYRSVKAVKVLNDPMTGMAKGFGFVRFFDEHEQIRALSDMQGAYCGSRPIRVSLASQKGKTSVSVVGSTITTPAYVPPTQYSAGSGAMPQAAALNEVQMQHMWSIDPTNTVLALTSLPYTEEEGALTYRLSKHGYRVRACQLYVDKTSAVVQFENRMHALDAMEDIQQGILGPSVKVTWSCPNPIPFDPLRVDTVLDQNHTYTSRLNRVDAYTT